MSQSSSVYFNVKALASKDSLEFQDLFIVATMSPNSREFAVKFVKLGKRKSRWCVPSFSFQGSGPKSVSMGRIPLYLKQEDVIIALIETLPLQLRR